MHSLPTDSRWDEPALAGAVKAGNERALEVLLQRHWTGLVRYALQFVDGQDEAEDIVQQAFVRLWDRRGHWRQEETLRPVLYQIARNLALNEQRRRKNFRRWARKFRGAGTGHGHHPRPHRKMLQEDLRGAIEKALDALPARRREIFTLVRVHQMSYGEAARVLQIAPQTVANQMSRAMVELREALEPFLDQTEPEEIPFPRIGAS